MRLGVVTTSYPRDAGDHAGHFVAAHVRELRALGHDVEVIAGGGTAERAPGLHRLASPLLAAGGAPDQLERAPLRALAAAASLSVRLAATVAVRGRRWDRVIAHWLVPSAIAALPLSAPLTAIAHGGDVHTLRRLGLLAPVLHALHLRGADLVFVSEELRALALAAAPGLAGWLGEALIQPMGVDLARFAALARTPATPPEILVVARLVPVKGVDIALAALAHVATGARLVIAGDGPERAHLEALARPLGERVTFLGALPTRAIDALLTRASVVVVPSRVLPSGRTEGTPLIAVEALAAGVPVVASAVGGLTALAPAAALVPPADPVALARAITAILSHPPAPAPLRAAISHLAWGSVARRLVRNL